MENTEDIETKTETSDVTAPTGEVCGTADIISAPAEDVTDSAADDAADESTVGELKDVACGEPLTLPPPKTARLTYSAYADMRPSPKSKYAPMGLGGYVLMLLAAVIPVFGFIVSVIVACASKKLARRRLALAIIIVSALLAALAAAAALTAQYVFDVDVLGYVTSFFGK